MNYSEKLTDPRWQKKRLEIMQRDNFTCRCCNDDKTTLHIHHLEYTGEPWDAPNECLITVCKYCHKTIEKVINKRNIDINTFKMLSIDFLYNQRLSIFKTKHAFGIFCYDLNMNIINVSFTDLKSNQFELLKEIILTT